ncbi:uncharacterized protein At4g37920, chloroplastic isoform X2 [Durio zibethinus]|uniref:Uncharacterized protein At4g37920, chloroplastic isoform X2 n=1 Tax=Durio zibethinus TaxID=66656 RepID=A0A6P6ATW7_DURZI|nr:uncharacterized protein At4g37920, chloroplastic isoform X2 [Durio zibethinus]
MELVCASCQACCFFPVRLKSSKVTSSGSSSALAFFSKNWNSSRFHCLSSKFSSRPSLGVNRVRLHRFSLAAIVVDKTAVPNDCDEQVSGPDSSDSSPIIGEINKDRKIVDEKGSLEGLDDCKMIRVCDNLIEVFMVDKPTPTDWRRLFAFSKEWSSIRPYFFKRSQNRADVESDPGMKHKLLRLGRKLKEIDEDVQRHNELLEAIKGAPSEISEIVARRRKDFTKEFFVHFYTVAESYYNNPTEQNALVKLGDTCLAAVQAYDTAAESTEAINAAELKLQDIMNSPSLDVACRKIDSLAKKNQLDSALVLMITKAWSAAKECSMTKDEVKDIMYHLYMTTVASLQRLLPKEIRIVKHLITIEDPEERLCALNDAFTPGEEFEGKDLDYLYTTPEKLHTLMRTLVDAYNLSPKGTLLREARDLMNPKIIVKLEELIKIVEKNFM